MKKTKSRPAKGKQGPSLTPGAVRTIHFEDNGQDFLEWDIDAHGLVIGCRPFQGFVWEGTKVLTANLYDRPRIEQKDGKVCFLVHPVVLIEEHVS